MKRPSQALSALTLLAAAAALPALVCACSSCHGASTTDAGAPSASASASGEASWLTRRAPLTGPSPSARINPKASREPDWDLDTTDPARDYAQRYVTATRRYGDDTPCMVLGASQPAGKQSRVEVKAGPTCPGGAGAVRDVLLVDVAADRLTVDDKSKRDPLARWPDGSDPEGPPQAIREIDRMQDWKSPLQDVIRRQLLVPVRLQAYGRGSYPVVSLAGWHGAIQGNAPADALKPLADALCAADGATPLGLLSASDRTLILRVKCPSSTRWEAL